MRIMDGTSRRMDSKKIKETRQIFPTDTKDEGGEMHLRKRRDLRA